MTMRITPHTHSGHVRLVTASRDRIYAAERRFDLVSLLTIMSAYAVLFAVMRSLHASTGAIVLLAVFVTLVGIGQAFLFRGAVPRGASALVGFFYWTLVNIPFALWNGAPPHTIVGLVVVSAIPGLVAGYVCGVFVGGVFLVAENLRHMFAHLNRRERRDAGSDVLPPRDGHDDPG
jgi:hypothetical protein